MRAERRAGGASPQRAAALASPRPSRGRRMSQAGGLSAAGNPRVSTGVTRSPAAEIEQVWAEDLGAPLGCHTGGNQVCMLEKVPNTGSWTDSAVHAVHQPRLFWLTPGGDMGAPCIALRPDRGAAVHQPLEAAGGVPAAEQNHSTGRAQGEVWRLQAASCCAPKQHRSCVSATGYDLGCLRRQRSCLYVRLQSRRLLQVIWKLFELCPTPEAAVAADTKDISAIIDTLGFYKRAAAFQRFSDDYVKKQVCCCACAHVPA